MIAVLRKVVDAGSGEGARWAAMRMHRIHSEMMTDLGDSSKLNAEWAFLTMLRDEGRRAAEAFGRGARRRHRRARDLRPRQPARGRLMPAELGRCRGAFLVAGLAFFIGAVLYLGAPVIVPVVEALVVWFVLNAMANGLRRLPVVRAALPWWVGVLLSAVVVAGARRALRRQRTVGDGREPRAARRGAAAGARPDGARIAAASASTRWRCQPPARRPRDRGHAARGGAGDVRRSSATSAS